MKRFLPLLIAVLVLAAGLLIWRYHKETSDSNLLSDPQNAAPPTREPGPISATTPSPGLTVPPESVSPAFVSFLQSESRNLDSPKIDAELAQRRMEEQARAMGDEEIRFARDLVLNEQNPANQRIVAASLIGMTGERGWSAAADIALRSFASERAEPHSVDEVRNSQAKAMALMEVDSLAEEAAKNPKAREELLRWASAAKDPTVRNYLQKKVRDLPAN